MTTHVSSTSEWREISDTSSIVVADFYATWCGPCKVIAPTFESLATKYAKPGRITFAKVDVDQLREVSQQYGVRAMPTFLVLRRGSVLETVQGVNPPALTAAVERAVKIAAPGPGASFKTPGRTLGSDSGSARTSATSQTHLQRGPVYAKPIAVDLSAIVNTLVSFIGLYLVSLFSLDPYMAAQKSKYNIHTPMPEINIRTGAAGGQPTGSGAARRPAAPKPKFGTLADLGVE